MKKFYRVFVITGLAFVLCCSLAIAGDKSKDNAMENCVKKDIKETSVVIGGKYSDPGGHKKKGAEQRCEYEKSKSTKEFKKKYSKGAEK